MKKALGVLLGTLIALAVLFSAFLGYISFHRSQVVSEIENESPTAGVTPLADIGATGTLEIMPLVEAAASSPQYRSEHGVSYLIKTDSSTILMDLGFNPDAADPSPLEHNMAQLGVHIQDIDTIVISHWHPDHTGGPTFWERHTFSTGNHQVPLVGMRVFVPGTMTYPGLNPIVASQPTKIADGVALTGVLPIVEVMNSHALVPALADMTTGLPLRNAEQALAINVSGYGIILITGCGHPTLPRLVARSQAAFDKPVVGVIGGLHLTEVPDAMVQGDVDLLKGLSAQLVGLSPHDSDSVVIDRFRAAFPVTYRDVMVGRPIRLSSD